MKRLLRLELFALVTLACSGAPDAQVANPTPAEPAPDIERGRVFTGPDGIRADVAEVRGGNQAFIKVSGSRSDVDGMVLSYMIKQDGRYLRYLTEVGGRRRATLVRETPRGGSPPTWRMYLGRGYPNGVPAVFDEDASSALDTAAIYREHQAQRADGSLEALQRFDRQGEERDEDEKLAKRTQSMGEACKVDVPMSIAWDTVDDETLKSLSISSYCSAPVNAMRQLCKSAPAQEYFKGAVKSIECRFGSDQTLDLNRGALTWTVHRDAVNNDEFARNQLLGQPFKDKTLQYQIKLADTRVCADTQKSRYIVLTPSGAEHEGLFYGDGNAFYQAKTSNFISEGWFFEPRHFNPQYNSSFRGLDLRQFSKVDIDRDQGSCKLTCGTKSTAFELLSGARAAEVARNMKVQPDPLPHEPYALARDRRGTYYYVDRSTKPGEERFFRLFVGRIGNVKLQRMRDIVSDSEGEIFSSRAGDLRLILDKSQASWITRRRNKQRNRQLKLVPVEKNLQMIYNRLGVYFGARLGNPCDDYGSE